MDTRRPDSMRCVGLVWRPAELVARFSDGSTRAAELHETRTPAGDWRAALRLQDLETGTAIAKRGRGTLGPLFERLAGKVDARWGEVDEAREVERRALLEQIRLDDVEIAPMNLTTPGRRHPVRRRHRKTRARR